jgi:single-stranded DNA-binding protein
MNHIVFAGKVVSAPILISEGGTSVCVFDVAVPGGKLGSVAVFPAQVRGKRAEAAHAALNPGMEVHANGNVRIETEEDPDGIKKKVATIVCSMINSLQTIFDQTTGLEVPVTAPAPASAKPKSTPAAKPPTAEDEIDYDDIPF